MAAIARLVLVTLAACTTQFGGVLSDYTYQCPYDLRNCSCTGNALDCENQGWWSLPDTIPSEFQHLFFSNNRITTVRELDMSYRNVLALYLTNNSVSTLEDNAFSVMENILDISLFHNKLESVNRRAFKKVRTLTTLDLSYNRIRALQDNDFNFEDLGLCLKTLSIHNNNIKDVSQNALTDLWNLKVVNMSNNVIENLSPVTFRGLSNLTILDLSHNAISIIVDDNFKSLTNLTRLQLNKNEITTITPGVFNGLSKLTYLDLGNNHLTQVPGHAFRSLGALQRVILDNNNVQRTDNSSFPAELKKLAYLQMNNMPVLSNIKNGTFKHLSPSLLEVRVSFCRRLKTIEVDAFGHYHYLNTLVLANNSLDTLPEHLYDWEELEHIDLTGNPWNCDCRLQWMTTRLRMTDGWKYIRCSSPPYLAGEKLGDLPDESFLCKQGNMFIGGSSGSGAVAGIVVLITFLAVTGSVYIIHKNRKNLPCFYKLPGRYTSLVDEERRDYRNRGDLRVEYQQSKDQHPDREMDGIVNL